MPIVKISNPTYLLLLSHIHLPFFLPELSLSPVRFQIIAFSMGYSVCASLFFLNTSRLFHASKDFPPTKFVLLSLNKASDQTLFADLYYNETFMSCPNLRCPTLHFFLLSMSFSAPFGISNNPKFAIRLISERSHPTPRNPEEVDSDFGFFSSPLPATLPFPFLYISSLWSPDFSLLLALDVQVSFRPRFNVWVLHLVLFHFE